MSDAPERIWVDGNAEWDSGSWGLDKEFINDVEYIRADLATPTHTEQLQQALALPAIAVLVEALCKSAEGWETVIARGLVSKKNLTAATILRDEALDALQRVGVEL